MKIMYYCSQIACSVGQMLKELEILFAIWHPSISLYWTGCVHYLHASVRGPHHFPDQRVNTERVSEWS